MRIVSPNSSLWFVLHASIFISGVLLSWLGDTWLRAIGASLAATGVAGVMVYVYVARIERIERGLEALEAFGLKKVFDGRSVRIREEYDSRCEKMHKQLDIMGFGLSSFLQDHRDDLPGWKRKADVRILVIDPDFPDRQHAYSDQRDLEEQSDRGRIRSDVENFRNAFGSLIGTENGKTFEIKLYKCLPSINVFRIDNELFWGPYLMNQASRNAPTFLVKAGGVLFERITNHFDAIWNDPNLSVPLRKNGG